MPVTYQDETGGGKTLLVLFSTFGFQPMASIYSVAKVGNCSLGKQIIYRDQTPIPLYEVSCLPGERATIRADVLCHKSIYITHIHRAAVFPTSHVNQNTVLGSGF